MMRLAACMATESGIEVVAPVHDAFLIVAPLEELDDRVAQMQETMAEASRIVLGGHEVRTDANIIRHPDRYMDEGRGRAMWEAVHRAMRATCTHGCAATCTYGCARSISPILSNNVG